MIPEFIHRDDAPFGVLPPGIHEASLDEVEKRFAWNERRATLFAGVRAVASALAAAGCNKMYLDGSFVTSKESPGDFDGCWEPRGVDGNKLDPVLLDFSDNRKEQKKKYGGEMFIASQPATTTSDHTIFEFFQIDKHNGEAKGIIAIQLGILP